MSLFHLLHQNLRRCHRYARNSGAPARPFALALARVAGGVGSRLSAGAVSPTWFSTAHARKAQRENEQAWSSLQGRVTLSAKGSKPRIGPLSPGCQRCVEGTWGCNYINRCCTRDCFFCQQSKPPRGQETLPTIEGYTTETPADHVAYLKTCSLNGVSFSGGEPLMVLDRVLSHLEAIRGEFGDTLYVWLYTNGDLVNDDTMQKLRDAGLDEIRFDLAGRDYDVSPIITARKFLPTVTVETPAIPEDFDQFISLLPTLKNIGVDHINLHQLMLNDYNWPRFAARKYHLDDDCQWSILESETCALRIMAWALEQGIEIPMNYCGSVYKYRYYPRSVRKRWAWALLQPYEAITEAGYIRALSLRGDSDTIGEIAAGLQSRGSRFKRESPDRVFIDITAIDETPVDGVKIQIDYYEARRLKGHNRKVVRWEDAPPQRHLVHQISDIDIQAVGILTAPGCQQPPSTGDQSETLAADRFERLATGPGPSRPRN